jgi:hypothetical protein
MGLTMEIRQRRSGSAWARLAGVDREAPPARCAAMTSKSAMLSPRSFIARVTSRSKRRRTVSGVPRPPEATCLPGLSFCPLFADSADSANVATRYSL